jgi:hypothetical protein
MREVALPRVAAVALAIYASEPDVLLIIQNMINEWKALGLM